jgi:hypothetical protein
MSARTILNPPLINELNGIFDGSTAIEVASITTGGGGTSIFNNTSVDFNAISVNGNVFSGAGITTGATATSVFNDTQVNFNKISVNGQCSAALYRGNGFGRLVESIGTPALNPGSNFAFTVTIPNFVGSTSTAYCASYVISSNSNTGAFYGIAVGFLSTDGVNTTVNVSMTNIGTGGLPVFTITLSIIAMN